MAKKAKAKSQVQLRREFVKKNPEDAEILAERKEAQSVENAEVEGDEETGEEFEASAVAEYTVPDAVGLIHEMDDADEIQAILETDDRKGVKEACEKRLAELG